MEHAQAVFQGIGEAPPEVERQRLQKHLPDWADLFAPREFGSPSLRPVHAAAPPELGHGATLATGRPGSRLPLSEAPPETAHAESVARLGRPARGHSAVEQPKADAGAPPGDACGVAARPRASGRRDAALSERR